MALFTLFVDVLVCNYFTVLLHCIPCNRNLKGELQQIAKTKNQMASDLERLLSQKEVSKQVNAALLTNV